MTLSAPKSSVIRTVRQNLQHYYDVKQPIYHTLDSGIGRRDQIVLGLFPRGHPLRVLDIGCGSGRFLRILKSLGHNAVGLEISPDAVNVAEQSGVKALVGDAESGAGIDDVGTDFDVITLLDVLEHTFDPSQVLRNLTPLVGRGGCLIASVPNIACFTARYQILCGRFPSSPSGIFDSGHIRWFTRSNLSDYIAKAGGLSLATCTAKGLPLFSLRGYSRLEKAHAVVFDLLARAWPSLFGYQLIFKLNHLKISAVNRTRFPWTPLALTRSW